MNAKHLFTISIIAAGLIWSGGQATASNSDEGMAPGGGMSSGSANGAVFSGMPDPNSPGGTKDAGKGSGGNTEMGKVRQGGEPDSRRSEASGSSIGKPSGTATSSDASSGSESSGSSSSRSGSGSASDDMKADQVGQRQGGDEHVNKGMKDGESQNAKAIRGEVLRVEDDKYYVKGEDGKEVGLHIDATTQKTGDINQGDRIEAQMNDQNHALSIRSTPTTDRRNEHSPDLLCTGKSLPKHQSGDRVDEEGCK